VCGIDHAKTAEPIDMLFGLVNVVDPVNRVLDWRAHWRNLANTVERLFPAGGYGSASMHEVTTRPNETAMGQCFHFEKICSPTALNC